MAHNNTRHPRPGLLGSHPSDGILGNFPRHDPHDTNFRQRGPSGGSSGPRMGPRGPQGPPMRPGGSGGPRMGPQGPEGGPRGPMMGPRGPGHGPRGPMMGPRGPEGGPRGPMMGPRGPEGGPRGPMMGPRGPEGGPRGPMMGPRGPEGGPRGPMMGPRGPGHGPRGPMTGPHGPAHGPRGPMRSPHEQMTGRRCPSPDITRSQSHSVPSLLNFALPEWPKVCKLCDVQIPTQPVHDNHYSGKKHRENLEKQKTAVKGKPTDKQDRGHLDSPAQTTDWPKFCMLCDVKMTTQVTYDNHYGGKRHQENLDKQKTDGEPNRQSQSQLAALPQTTDWPKFCNLCDVKLTNQSAYDNHYSGYRHQDKLENQKKEQHTDGEYPSHCYLCEKKFTSSIAAKEHFEGKKHKQKDEEYPKHCDLCETRFSSSISAKEHFDGQMHQQKEREKDGSILEGSRGNVQEIVAMMRGRGGKWRGRRERRGSQSLQDHNSRGTRSRGRGRSRGQRGGAQGTYGSQNDPTLTGDQERGRGRRHHRGRGRARGRNQSRGRADPQRDAEDKVMSPGTHRADGSEYGDGSEFAGSEYGSEFGDFDDADSVQDTASEIGDDFDDDVDDDEMEQVLKIDQNLLTSIVEDVVAKTKQRGMELNMDKIMNEVRHILQKQHLESVKTESQDEKPEKPTSASKTTKPIQLAAEPYEDVVVRCKNVSTSSAEGSGMIHKPDTEALEDPDDSDQSDISNAESVGLSESRSSRRRRKQRQRQRDKGKQEKTSSDLMERRDHIEVHPDKDAGRKIDPSEQTAFDNTSDSSDIRIDENAVLEVVVKKHSGECCVRDVQLDAAHLFPPQFDIYAWLIKSRRFKVFKTIDSNEKDLSMVIVHIRELRLCTIDACEFKFCPLIHLCRGSITGTCTWSGCKASHSLEDEHNSWYLRDKNIRGNFSSTELMWMLKCSTLHVCSYFAKGEPCPSTTKYQHCPQLHICPFFIQGSCRYADEKCKFGHSYETPQANLLFMFYQLTKTEKSRLGKLIIVPWGDRIPHPKPTKQHPQPKPNIEAKSPPQPIVMHGQQQPVPHNVESEPRHLMPERPVTPVSPKTPVETAKAEDENAWMTVHIYQADSKVICDANLQRKCKPGAGKCTNHHFPMTYAWQVRKDNIWETLDSENVRIEALYSDVKQNDYHWLMNYGGDNQLFCINFADMTCSNASGDTLSVRRLSTKSYTEQAHGDDRFTTKWLWYWLDNSNVWKMYEMDAVPYQDILESKFQAGEYACFFETDQFRYLLDLNKLEQFNLQTTRSRAVRRRPVLVTEEDLLLNKKTMEMMRHVVKGKLPKGWSPMNTLTMTVPDLILLTESSNDYKNVEKAFCQTIDATSYKIKRIIQVQNLALWAKYSHKKEVMMTCTHLKGEPNEKQLFHGTSSEDAVRCICKQGFDWRVSGKNGTVYGEGCYFARDAQYSNNYTDRSSTGPQFMFYCSVLTGATTQGKPSYNRAPPLDPSKPHSDLYDSCVDQPHDPGIYVVFHDDQSYPQFLIEYCDVRAPSAQPQRRSSSSASANVSSVSTKPKYMAPSSPTYHSSYGTSTSRPSSRSAQSHPFSDPSNVGASAMPNALPSYFDVTSGEAQGTRASSGPSTTSHSYTSQSTYSPQKEKNCVVM